MSVPTTGPGARHLPVRPDLDQLRRQAKELLRAIKSGDPSAREELSRHHPDDPAPENAKLADAQLVLARSYHARSWPRLVQACRLIDAIWEDDLDTVLRLIRANPKLRDEHALVRPNSNWGPPMTYAANLGRDRIIDALLDLGATDLASAVDRATLQGKVETARRLHARMGAPRPPDDALGSPAYTLSAAGTAFLLEQGARVRDDDGRLLAPVDVVLETDSRSPTAKHEILEMYARHGSELPDTPTMALHRGRIDLLEAHLRRDPGLLRRTFAHEEMYPPALGCHDEVLATHGTPLAGATLLHMAIDYDEMEIARWLLDRGMDPNVRAAVDRDGFGGHTPLFSAVVAQPHYRINQHGRPDDAPYARLLLDRGADPNARASLRKRMHPGYIGDDELREYRDVTPLSWGVRFHFPMLVSRAALRVLEERGGGR